MTLKFYPPLDTNMAEFAICVKDYMYTPLACTRWLWIVRITWSGVNCLLKVNFTRHLLCVRSLHLFYVAGSAWSAGQWFVLPWTTLNTSGVPVTGDPPISMNRELILAGNLRERAWFWHHNFAETRPMHRGFSVWGPFWASKINLFEIVMRVFLS